MMLREAKTALESFVDFKKYAIFQCLIGGLFVSTIGSIFVGFLLGSLSFFKDPPFIQQGENKDIGWILAIGFSILWPSISAVAYSASVKEGEDLYTWLRKKLAGTWNFQLETWGLNADQKWVRQAAMYPVHLFIDPKNQKLRAQVYQISSEFFEDLRSEAAIIGIEEGGSHYRMYAVLQLRQALKSDYRASMKMDAIDMTILLSLRVETPEIGLISKINGHWYDVDNVIWRVISSKNSDMISDALRASFGDGINNFQGSVWAHRVDNPKT